MKITVSKLIRLAGLSAMLAGILFIVVQTIHPPDLLSSVTSGRWAIVHYLGIAMCFLGLLGITGIYARQVEETGWLGLAGYLMISVFYALSMGFQFAEALISPLLWAEAPKFVESFLALPSRSVPEMNLGALESVWLINGVMYMLGGLLFGIATLRAGILSRWAGGLLAFSTVLPLLTSSLIQHPYDRIFAVPMGLSLAWMGYALLSEQRKKVLQPLPGRGSAQLR